MPQRVKPVTRWGGGSLSASMTGVGVVGVTAQEVTGAGAHAVSVGVASSGSGSAVIPGEAYTLADATAGLPFVVDQPIAPDVSLYGGSLTDVTVTTNGELTTALGLNGRRITIATGAYSGFTISGLDQEIIIGAGCTFGNISFPPGGTARRIIIRCADPRNMNASEISLPEFGSPPEDILIDGVRSVLPINRNYTLGNRVAFINCQIQGTTLVLSSFNGVGGGLIVGNCEILGPGTADAIVRFTSNSQIVFVDNRVSESASYNTFRIHADYVTVANAFVARNQFEGTRMAIIDTGTGAVPAGTIDNVWFHDNDFYKLGGDPWAINTSFNVDITAYSDIGYLSLQNNRCYGSASGWISGSLPNYDIAGNTIQAYPGEGPPAWEFQ